jgi:putative flippase GtrA
VATTPAETRRRRIKRLGKFGLVGVLNTLIDFLIFNLLSGEFAFSLVAANLVSTTAAMSISFLANKHVVFEQRQGSLVKQAAIFYVVTAFGLYVLQTGTIAILTDIWLQPVHAITLAAHKFGFTGHDAFLIKNSAKAAATVISLGWNYVMYKKVVFK